MTTQRSSWTEIGIAARRLPRVTVSTMLALLMFTASAGAQVAGTVEAGLAQLAQEIAEKSKAAEGATIAVLPFPHADGSCSVFSTYIVDELILTLFSVPNPPAIVERSQLEAIIGELAIGAGGLLNPATTKQLGNLSGVSALTIGTITDIGDSVRLNARLVATETGRTISAAAVTIPKTPTVAKLLSQPVAAGPNCRGGGSAGVSASTGMGGSVVGKEESDATAVPEYRDDTIRLTISSMRIKEQRLTLTVMLENTAKEMWGVALDKTQSANFVDNRSGFCGLELDGSYVRDGQTQGINTLSGWSDWHHGEYTYLTPGSSAIVTYYMNCTEPLAGTLGVFTGRFWKAGARRGTRFSITLSNIPLNVE